MKTTLSLSAVIGAPPAIIYRAWLSSRGHSAMTGSPATAGARVGARFRAWDGYISGRNVALVPDRRIEQSWRSTDFPEDAPDSLVVVTLEPVAEGTRVSIRHTGYPGGQTTSYRQGWKDFYFTPMKAWAARRRRVRSRGLRPGGSGTS